MDSSDSGAKDASQFTGLTSQPLAQSNAVIEVKTQEFIGYFWPHGKGYWRWQAFKAEGSGILKDYLAPGRGYAMMTFIDWVETEMGHKGKS